MGRQHVLTQNTAGQSQPQGSNDHTTAANATGQDAPSTKQMLTDGQDTNMLRT